MKKMMMCCLLWVSFGVVYGQELSFAETQIAAEEGDVEAQNSLGFMYKKGRVVLKDPNKAFYWFEKAANQNHPKGQYSLGVLYFHGNGTILDKKEAAYWIEQSYKNGNTKAKDFWEENELWKYK